MLRFLKNKIYIIVTVFGLVITSLVVFFAWPLYEEVKNNSATLLSEKNDTAVLSVQSDQIESFKKIYHDYEPNLDNMDKLFIDPKNPVDFIKFLETTASASLLLDVKISLIADPKNQSVTGFQLAATDDFLKMLDFSKRVENGPYLVEIKNALIVNADTDTSSKNYPSGKVSATFLINAFSK